MQVHVMMGQKYIPGLKNASFLRKKTIHISKLHDNKKATTDVMAFAWLKVFYFLLNYESLCFTIVASCYQDVVNASLNGRRQVDGLRQGRALVVDALPVYILSGCIDHTQCILTTFYI